MRTCPKICQILYAEMENEDTGMAGASSGGWLKRSGCEKKETAEKAQP